MCLNWREREWNFSIDQVRLKIGFGYNFFLLGDDMWHCHDVCSCRFVVSVCVFVSDAQRERDKRECMCVRETES